MICHIADPRRFITVFGEVLHRGLENQRALSL